MANKGVLKIKYEKYPGDQGYRYENPPSYPPCICEENKEYFVSRMEVYCPYHGVEKIHWDMIRRPKHHIRPPKNSKYIQAAKVPPKNCANGFIITFENQEEMFCRPHDVASFFKQPIDRQILDIVLTVNFLAANEVMIFQQTTRPTRVTYFEIAQTPLDVEDKLKWVPLGPGYNYKYLVKQWYDKKGYICFMERKIPSFQPFDDTEPLNCFFMENLQTDINPAYNCPKMEVTFLGINNPWYYSRAVPFDRAKENRSKQVRENNLTKEWLQEFDAYMDQGRVGSIAIVTEKNESQVPSSPSDGKARDINMWCIACPTEEYYLKLLKDPTSKRVLQAVESQGSQQNEQMQPTPKIRRENGLNFEPQQENGGAVQLNTSTPVATDVSSDGNQSTATTPSSLSLSTTVSADNVLSLSVLDTSDSEDA